LVTIPECYYERQPIKASIYLIVHVSIILFSGVAAYYIDQWWAYMFAFILVGARAQALYILQHELMHLLLFKSRKINTIIGNLVSALLGTRYFDGRFIHMKHHKVVGQPEDPNEYFHSVEKRKPFWSLFSFFLFQLMGGRLLLMFSRVFTLLKNSGNKGNPATHQTNDSKNTLKENNDDKMKTCVDIVVLLLIQGLVFVGISLLSSPWVYILLYFLPLITLTSFFETIRSFSEHVLPGFYPTCEAEKTRNYYMSTHFVERFFISQFNFHYQQIQDLIFSRFPPNRLDRTV